MPIHTGNPILLCIAGRLGLFFEIRRDTFVIQILRMESLKLKLKVLYNILVLVDTFDMYEIR